MDKSEIASPTASPEAVITTAQIDAYERRYVATADIPNAFIQADVKVKPGDPRIILVIRGILVDMLCKLAPEVYTPFVEYKKGKKALLKQPLLKEAQLPVNFFPRFTFHKSCMCRCQRVLNEVSM